MKIQIYQIYYKDEQKEYLDASFIPYDNAGAVLTEWCEYGVFWTEYKKGSHKLADYTGFLSWKFGQKTDNMPGSDVLAFIKNNAGYNVYFINPFRCGQICLYDSLTHRIKQFLRPKKYFQSPWHQGEVCHKGLIPFIQNIFNKLGYNINILNMRGTEENTLFCNYWIGDELFWDEYMKFTIPIFDYLAYSCTPDEKDFLQKTADASSGLNFIPYIMERLFTTFLLHNDNISSCGYHI